MTKIASRGSCLKLDLGELENHLWAHVESKISKKKKKKKLAGQHTYTDGQELDGPYHRHAFIQHFISSYAVLLSFFLVNTDV